MRLLGFPISGNNLYIEIVQLYSEILCIGLVILYIIAECIAIVLYNFSIEKSNFSYNYSSKLEGMLDIAFILFPTFIIIYVLIPSLGFLYHTEDSLEHLFYSFTLDVIGHQWYWSYQLKTNTTNYLFNIQFVFDELNSVMVPSSINRLLTVDNTLLFPILTNILVTVTSYDVIHSWSVPQLGIKIDAIPGRIASGHLFSFIENKWVGQCSELCGIQHGFMPIVLESISQKEFFSIFTKVSIKTTFKLLTNTTIFLQPKEISIDKKKE